MAGLGSVAEEFYLEWIEGLSLIWKQLSYLSMLLTWLQGRYADFRFFTERDIVWTVQLQVYREIENQGLPYRVFNDHTILPRIRTDLAILKGDSVEVAAEFKYEPSHARSTNQGGDIWPSKFNPSVVMWDYKDRSVKKDIQRIQEFINQGKSKAAYSVFIDEGGYFRHRPALTSSKWIDWDRGMSVLWARTSGGIVKG